MADADLRRAERHAETPEARASLLVARLRAGQVSREQVALAAYCGDEAALTLVEECRDVELSSSEVYCLFCDRPEDVDFGGWLSGLEQLARPLPDVVGTDSPCPDPDCEDGRWPDYPPSTVTFACETCDGTGRIPYVVPAPRYVLTLAAVGAGWEALPAWEVEHATDPGHAHPRRQRHQEGHRYACCLAPRRALTAAEDWLRCPCEEHERALTTIEGTPEPFHRLLEVVNSGRSDLLTDFIVHVARLTGEPTTRSAVSRRVVAWTLGASGA